MTLDLRTLWLVLTLVFLLFALLQAGMWLLRRQESAFIYWSVSNLCIFTAYLLFTLGGQSANWSGASVGNFFLPLGWVLMWAGMRRFSNQGFHAAWIWLLPIPMGLLCAFYPPLAESWPARTVLAAGALCLMCAMVLRDALQAQCNEPLQMRRAAIAAFGIVFLFSALRYITNMLAPPDANYLFDNIPSNVIAVVMAPLLGTTWNILLILMANERVQVQLQRESEHDPLTQALNRTGFAERGQRLIRQAKLRQQPVSVLLMDLDHFKRINDRHGHAVGDQVLRAFVEVARRSLGPDDLLGRSGGEEFCALLPCSDLKAALAAADRLRNEFGHTAVWSEQHQVGTTVSIGAAVVRGAETLEQTLMRADQALYLAKRTGRNQVRGDS